MHIITVAEHSFCPDLINKDSSILDIGCRGFMFSNYFKKIGGTVYPVDIAELALSSHECENILSPEITIGYYQCGITDYNGTCMFTTPQDPQATSLVRQSGNVPCYTLEEFSRLMDIPFWDLIKIDIEGSEYEVIMSLTKAPAKQLSIEFHLHTGIYDMAKMKDMEEKLLLLGYEIVQHELTEAHGAGFNYWDSLFILK